MMNTFIYFEIVNIKNNKSKITARWTTLDKAEEDILNHADDYQIKGTGKIYRVELKVLSSGEILEERILIKNRVK